MRLCLVEVQRALARSGTERAAVRPLQQVRVAAVKQQSRAMWEAAAADAAGVGAVAPLVHALVQVEAAVLAEALAALTADVERLAGMGVAVHAQLSSVVWAQCSPQFRQQKRQSPLWARLCHSSTEP